LRIGETEGEEKTSRGISDKTEGTNLEWKSMHCPLSYSTLNFELLVTGFLPDVSIKDQLLKGACQFAPDYGFCWGRPYHHVRAQCGTDTSCNGENVFIIKINY
jgi:hypothetical protein